MTADAPSKAERLAHNAVLTLIARGAMVVATACLIPAGIGLLDMRTDIKLMRSEVTGKIDQVEQRLAARIAAVEDRQGAQSRRMDITDTRIERLTEISAKFSVDVAVLTEQIRALLAANQRQPSGAPR